MNYIKPRNILDYELHESGAVKFHFLKCKDVEAWQLECAYFDVELGKGIREGFSSLIALEADIYKAYEL